MSKQFQISDHVGNTLEVWAPDELNADASIYVSVFDPDYEGRAGNCFIRIDELQTFIDALLKIKANLTPPSPDHPKP
ncbi:MAG: hypothetical protein E6Q97_06230 [Desulfurellales bacterium]|nr:MAG: hypothetical protein E6Q97_06230 [Desulfurellales bacterium]